MPLLALASAFEMYCDLLLVMKNESDWARCIISKLQASLSQGDSSLLVNIIPKLGLVLGTYSSSITSEINCQNALQRLHHLIHQFVEVITLNSPMPVTLVLDDLQWVDDLSLSILCQILRKHKSLFFIGCCRDNKMAQDHSFSKMLDMLQLEANVTTVTLRRIEDSVVNEMISELLHLSPRIVSPLARIVHNRTKGNALFMIQLLQSLYSDGLLRLDYAKRRWTWDIPSICSTKLPENVATCFLNEIGKLPLNVHAALHVLSLFGSYAKLTYLSTLENEFGLRLIADLFEAEGLVMNINGKFQFCHNAIQEACYHSVGDEGENCKLYFAC